MSDLEDINWIKIVTGIGGDFNRLRREISDMLSGLPNFNATAVKEDDRILGDLDVARDNVQKLEGILEEMMRLHEQLRTMETPQQLPQQVQDFHTALVTSFLYAMSRVEAIKNLYELVLETQGEVIPEERKDDFTEAGAKWLLYDSMEKQEIGQSLLRLEP